MFPKRSRRATTPTLPRAELLERRVLLTTYVVSTTADSGPNSLRAAVTAANANPGPDDIRFDLPGEGVHRITLASALPSLDGPTTIDASTQPGFAGAPVVELVGQTNFAGLVLNAAGTVRSLAIGNFERGVVFSEDKFGGAILGCYVGLDSHGSPLPNGIGIHDMAGSEIGGLAPGDGNVISANREAGVYINWYGFNSPGAVIRGNYIGTDPTGAAAIPNDSGIDLNIEGTIQIGGTVAQARNVISGNTTAGIRGDLGSGSGYVQGNYIGTDITGERAIPNGTGAVFTYLEHGIIGGATADARNVISGNLGSGLHVNGTSFPAIQGNYIGASATGTPLGNGGSGILAAGAIVIGGVNAGEQNVVAHNGQTGIAVVDEFGRFAHAVVSIRPNAIYDNAGLGIDLNADGPTPNDAGDADVGPNQLQNAPVLTAVSATPTATDVDGTLQSLPSRAHRIDFYAAPTRGPAGDAHAQLYLGSASATTNASGNASFHASLTSVPAGCYVTATASPASGLDYTSEFSSPRAAVDAIPPVVTSTAFVYDSGPARLVFAFSEDVSAALAAADVQLQSLTKGAASPPPLWTLEYDHQSNVATFTFSAPLPNGDYRATLPANFVTDPAGNPLTADATLDFWFLVGDANRDRAVDFVDLAALAQSYNTPASTWAQGDFNADGRVDFNDLVLLAQNYSKSLPDVAPTLAAATAFSSRPIRSAPAITRKPIAARPPKIDLPPAPPPRKPVKLVATRRK
jgi:hypothetical protein